LTKHYSSIRVRGAECGIEAIMLGVITSIGAFLFGYDTGQICSTLLFPDFINHFGQTQPDGSIAFDATIKSLIVSLMSIGTMFGALAGAYTADWFGRRNLAIEAGEVWGVIFQFIGDEGAQR
jgi:SP family sugar:H+ symporter-like MFS transporter